MLFNKVARDMDAGSVRLVYCDGPYGLDFGDWDTAKEAALVDWYAPFFDAFDRVCMPSASLVVWGRSDSWAWLHCDLLNRGWHYAGSIIWDKGTTRVMMADPDVLRSWAQSHEHCGIYQRDELATPTCAATTVHYAAGASDENWIRKWLGDEWSKAGLKRSEADTALGTKGMAGHYFGASQWALPTWDAYQKLAAYAAEHGKSRPERPWLVHKDVADSTHASTYDHLVETYDRLCKIYEHLRAEYERLRAPFQLDRVRHSVFREQSPTTKSSRHGHPCEKPPTLTRLLIETLTHPGELVFEPFGGSSPVARACEALPQDKRRSWVSCELDEGYVARTLEMLKQTQGSLF